MARIFSRLSPDLVRQLETLGDAGAEILRRLTEAERLIEDADSGGKFAHPVQRQKARQQKISAQRAFDEAMAEAQHLLNVPPFDGNPQPPIAV